MTSAEKNKKPLIILTAGGTGGHVYPADALAEELEKRGFRLALVTDSRGKNNYKGKLAEIPNYAVWAGGLVGKNKFTKIKNLCKTCFGILQACFILVRLKPSCIIGFGGYASFPCAMAAILLGKDLVIHEQNSVMSRTNRFLSRYASLVAQSFRNVKYTPENVKTVLTGMPVRQSVAAVGKLPYPETTGSYKLLVIGGSQGAKIFGEVIPQAVKLLNKDILSRLEIHQQCRRDDVEMLRQTYNGLPVKTVISHFFDNMPELYASSHLIISRSGASSVCEIAAAGIPSILVPLPTAADNHQNGNARELENTGGSIVIQQTDFTPEKLGQTLTDLFSHPETLKKMSEKTKKAGITNAAEIFADAVEKNIFHKK